MKPYKLIEITDNREAAISVGELLQDSSSGLWTVRPKDTSTFKQDI